MGRVNFIAARRQHGLPPSLQTSAEYAKRILLSWIPAPSTSLRTGFVVMTILMVGGAYPTETFAAGPYKMDWYTIDGGGGTSKGGPYVLTGTIGQADAGYSSGDKYEVLGGFWSGGPICTVGFDDFARFAEQWFQTASGLAGDLDSDGDVDFDDLTRLAEYWLECCPYPWPLR
jgi:hypothetical protein